MEILVSRASGTEVLDAMVADFQNVVRLGAFRDFDGNFPVNGRDVDGGSQSAVDEAKRDFDVDVVAVALEDRVAVHDDFDIEIPVWTAVDSSAAFPRYADLLAIVDAGGDRDG